MLDRIVVKDFKSYRGEQTLGPLKSFTSVIGPNGAGKSNLMDAISFVLGVRSATLRSSALKDLIYRSGKRRGMRKGKPREEHEADSQSDEEDEGASEGEDDVLDGERSGWVMAVYIDREDKEWTFQRTISIAGTSEYKLNNKVVTYKKYNQTLERFNILVKAKNFLVFQGDVEQVASQSSKDLAKLVDQISGSLDLKEDYDAAAAALAKATDQSTSQHKRRQGVNQEIKQYKEMKKEAQRWEDLNNQKDSAVIRHLLWRLYHIEQGIKANTDEIESKAEHLRQLRKDHAKFDDANKQAKKELARAQKDYNKQDKAVRNREKDLEDARPELVEIQARIDHATRRIEKSDKTTAKVTKDLEPAQQKLDQLNKDLAAVQRALDQHQEEQRELQQQQGIELNQADVDEYRTLRGQANSTAVAERAELNTRNHEETAIKDKLATAQDGLEVAQRKLDRLQAEAEVMQDRKADDESKIRRVTADLNAAKQKHSELAARRTQANQTEQELNEKLEETYGKLQQANADRQESERDAKFRETLSNLKRTFPGVKGRVVDLCKPTQSRYGVAVQTVLGRNINSVVVDTEKTAIACIEYMRVQRSGQATFIPLETIQVTRPNDKYRTFHKNAHLAIDVINYDPSVEKAMQHACGNALVCDTIEVAKHVCYERGQEVKAVTLEGTVIHRSGLITGGTSSHSSKHFEEREVEGLRRRETDLRAKLAEIFKNKPRPVEEDNLKLEITKLESDLTIVKDDLASTNTRLNGLQAEIKTVTKTVKDLQRQVNTHEKELESINRKQAALRQVVEEAEDEVFAEFCTKIGVDDIREYEQKQLKVQQDSNASQLKFDTQIKKLGHQIEFQQELVQELEDRLARIQEVKEKEEADLARNTADKATKEGELNDIEEEIKELQDKLGELQGVLDEKTAALEDVRKSGSKSAKVLDKALKEIAACNDAIEKLASDRFSVYRRCKLDEIDLPLAEGSRALDEVPIEEGVPEQVAMDIDGPEDETQQAARVNDYGVEVDFDELEEDDLDDATEAMGEQLLAEVAKIQAELDKMSPNLKAIERLGDSESRLTAINNEFENARESAKEAKDTFNALRKQRTDLFNKAFTHISEKIDGVYKDLTKGQSAPDGGVAYLSLENNEEPFLGGITYHAMPPMKRFRDMDQLSGGEKTMAALALLFAIHSYHPSPFFVLDEVDAALDNLNVSRIARYVRQRANKDFQFIVISLKAAFYEKAEALVGIYRDEGSKSLTLDLEQYHE